MFECSCSKCTAEPDWLRALPCPRCSCCPPASACCSSGMPNTSNADARSCLDSNDNTLGSGKSHHHSSSGCCPGFLVCDMHADTAGHLLPWACDSCGGCYSHAEVAACIAARAGPSISSGLFLGASTLGSVPLCLHTETVRAAPATVFRRVLGIEEAGGEGAANGAVAVAEGMQATAVAATAAAPEGAHDAATAEGMPVAAVVAADVAVPAVVAADVEAHLEERVHNLNCMLAAGTVGVSLVELEGAESAAATLLGPRHWTTNSLRWVEGAADGRMRAVSTQGLGGS